MRKSIAIFLAFLLLLAILIYIRWPVSRGNLEELAQIDIRSVDQLPRETLSADHQAVRHAGQSAPDVDGPKLRQLARSGDPFPNELSMSYYWEIVTSDIREVPPEPKRIGDAIADGDEAYRLYVYYRWCGTALRTAGLADTQLKRAADQTLSASAQELEHLGELAEFVFDRYEMCAPIPPEVDCHQEAFLWLSQAVRMGHEIAQTTYYGSALETLMYRRPYNNSVYPVLAHPELIDEFKVTGRFALSEALNHGHPEAYLAMSSAVLDGVVFPRDPVMAFAYLRAAELESPADYHFYFGDGIERQKQSIAQYLNDQELVTAEKLAQGLRRSDGG